MVYQETIELKDKVSAEAAHAAASVATLTKGLEAAQKSLIKASALGDTGAYDKALASAGRYSEALAKMGPKHDAITNAARAEAEGLANLKGAQEYAESGAMSLDSAMAGLAGGLEAVAAAGIAVGAVLGAIIFAGAKFAIEASEAKNASLSLWTALAQGKMTGDEVDDMLDDLRTKTGLTKDSLAPLTEAFLRMGITGKAALEGLTVAAASAEALAKGGGEAFTKLYQQANAAAETGAKLTLPYKKLQNQLVAVGLNVDDLAKEMNLTSEELQKGLKAGTIDAKKFGDALESAVTKKGVGPLETLAQSSKNLGNLLKEYLGDLFEDLGPAIAPFMKEVKDLFGILDSKANPSGQALKAGIGAFFKEVFAIGAKVIPMIKHFLLDVIIYGLKAYLAIKPTVKAIKEFFQTPKGAAILNAVLEGFGTALKVIGVVILVVIGALALFAAIAFTAGAAIATLIGIMLGTLAQVFEAVAGWAKSGATAAYDFVVGIVNGISTGAGMVVDAVKGLAGKAVDGLKGALGIASPSKIGLEVGANLGGSVAQGTESAVPEVHSAATSLGSVAATSTQAAASTGGGGGSSSASSSSGAVVNFQPGAIVINGAGKSAEEITEGMLSLMLERFALLAGL